MTKNSVSGQLHLRLTRNSPPAIGTRPLCLENILEAAQLKRQRTCRSTDAKPKNEWLLGWERQNPGVSLFNPLLSASQRLRSDLRCSSARGFGSTHIAEKRRSELRARIRRPIQRRLQKQIPPCTKKGENTKDWCHRFF